MEYIIYVIIMIDSLFLVLPGRESTLNEITEQSYFSLIFTTVHVKYKFD